MKHSLKLKLRLFYKLFAHLYDRNIQKAITKERDPIFIVIC